MGLGESMMNWLRAVDKDQNLQGIGNLTSTSMSDRVRRWFRRQDLTPTLETGYYDDQTERYVLGVPSPSLGDAKRIITDTSVITANQATGTLTCAAGHAYRVTHVIARNATAAPEWQLEYTPSGGTAATLLLADEDYVAACAQTILGGMVPSGAAARLGYSVINPIWIQAGDTLVITETDFTAGDDTTYWFVYEDYTV